MSISLPGHVPPGWYPDPGGERQWRVWTGTAWSDVTRPYGEPSSREAQPVMIPLITSLQWLLRYGIVAFFAGTGVVTSTLAHWPGTNAPVSLWLAETAFDTGFALLIVGTALFALAMRELDGHWSVAALVPGYNVLATSERVIQRIAGKAVKRRVMTHFFLITLYITQSHFQPWLGVALVIAAADQMQWIQVLVDQLVGPTTTSSSFAP